MNKLKSMLFIFLTLSISIPCQAKNKKSKIIGLTKIALYSSAAIYFGKSAANSYNYQVQNGQLDMQKFFNKFIVEGPQTTKEHILYILDILKKNVLCQEIDGEFMLLMQGIASAKFAIDTYRTLDKYFLNNKSKSDK